MRLITVQFAIPDDDVAALLPNFRDEIQEALYENHGLAGSFNIIGVREIDAEARGYFEPQDNGLSDAVMPFMQADLAKIKAQKTADLAMLLRWAQMQAARGILDMKGADQDAVECAYRLSARGFCRMDGSAFVMLAAGYDALGWSAEKDNTKQETA